MDTKARNQTALHFAVQGNYKAIVKLLLTSSKGEAKYLAGIKDVHDQTALHWAAPKGLFEILTAFFKSQPQTGMKPDDFTKLKSSFDDIKKTEDEKTKQQAMKELITKLEENYPLMRQIKQDSYDICELLYNEMSVDETGINDICARMKDRHQTALHFAVQGNRLDLVKLLLSNESVKTQLIGIEDNKGCTALAWASKPGFEEIANLLKEEKKARQVMLATVAS